MSARSKGRRRPTQHLRTEKVETIRRGEVIDLGELGGQEREVLTATFTYFGERYAVNPDLSELDVIDFLEAAETIDATDSRSMTMLKSFVRRVLAEQDFEAFWQTVRDRRQTIQEVMELMWKLIEGVSGNPTGQPSGSSAGRPVTTVPLPPDASEPASANEGLREKYLRQIERFEALGTGNGVAMAAQIALAAEARGVDVNRDHDPLLSVSG